MMCAQLLRHKPNEEQGWFYRVSERVFEAVIAFYGNTLRCRSAASARHAARRCRQRWSLTILLFIVIPKGFFPVQDTGVILGISEAPQNISFAAMSRAATGAGERDSARPRGRQPFVLHRHRRHEHHDEQRPHPDQSQAARRSRQISASEIIRRLQTEVWPKVDGITLFMQPVQDLTVEDRVSRTQFQYTLEDPDAKELAAWVPKLLDKLKTLA